MGRSWPLVVVLLLGGCGDDGPPLRASDIRAYAPLPGTEVGVAYLVVSNGTGAAIVIDAYSSPDFGRVELHETAFDGDTATMRPLASLEVPPRGSVRLEENGRHLMLVRPTGDATPGHRVTLHFARGEDVLLVVEAELRDRYAGRRPD